MDRNEAYKRVEALKGLAGDPEHAHSTEDDLYDEFVLAIANEEYDTLKEAAEVAREILRSNEIDFPR